MSEAELFSISLSLTKPLEYKRVFLLSEIVEEGVEIGEGNVSKNRI